MTACRVRTRRHAAGEAPSRTRLLLGHAAVFAIGATSSVQIANVTVTALSVVCLLLVPAWLLMTHRGVDLVPLVLAALGWISFLASCLVNDVSVLWPNAVAPAAFGLYLMGLTVLTGRAVDAIAAVLAGLAAGTVVFFLTQGIELTHTGNFLDLWKYGIASAVTILIAVRTDDGAGARSGAAGVAGGARIGEPRVELPVACARLRPRRGHAVRQPGSSVPGSGADGSSPGSSCVGLVFAYVMPIAARAGLFGPALQRKTVEQDATDVPLLLAGRTEPPMTITAIPRTPASGLGERDEPDAGRLHPG